MEKVTKALVESLVQEIEIQVAQDSAARAAVVADASLDFAARGRALVKIGGRLQTLLQSLTAAVIEVSDAARAEIGSDPALLARVDAALQISTLG